MKTREKIVCHAEDIVCVEADGSYVYIFTKNGNKITPVRLLRQIEETLPPGEFYRCHRSFIVNLRFVIKIHRKGKWTLEMTNGKIIPVPRAKQKELKERLSEKGYNIY